jgi:hypothetical protein
MSSFGAGWYGLETDGANWWRWLNQDGEIELFLQQQGQLRMRGEMAVVGAGERVITLAVVGENESSVSQTVRQAWFSPFASSTLTLSSGSHKIIVRASGPPSQLGSDRRNFRIGVRNVYWEMLPDSTAPQPAKSR